MGGVSAAGLAWRASGASARKGGLGLVVRDYVGGWGASTTGSTGFQGARSIPFRPSPQQHAAHRGRDGDPHPKRLGARRLAPSKGSYTG
eukprot:scaffold5312_cov118-Isochrysis_galbana.AAC.2